MAKKLLIVESPAKAKTIKKYLGKDYEVSSSYGHIADLPEDKMGIEIKDGKFIPTYIVPDDKKKIVKQLSDLTKKAETVYLASDEDREGEAIAWHLQNILKLNDKSKRIVFHEITKKAVTEAISHPRDIDQNLVNAQQARRLLDRLVGYKLSPVLWKKIKKGLSAGRVQSVATRLIVEREKEIKSFVPESKFKVEGEFIAREENLLRAKLQEDFEDEAQVKNLLESFSGAQFFVDRIEKKPGKKTPPTPFTTSLLQQEASRLYGFPVSKTMQIAQYLYEHGYITYMRTDSLHLSEEAISAAADVIKEKFGKEYSQPKQYKTKKKGAQEAHEAIRPTQLDLEKPPVDRDALKLYQLIWKRTLASQMKPAEVEHTHIYIGNNQNDKDFVAKGQVITFPGFLKIYQTEDQETEKTKQLPKLTEGEHLDISKIIAKQVFQRPPARYTEATLVRKLEELGIGRPSTYAPTINTIQKRGYVEKKTLPAKTRTIKQFILENSQINEQKIKEKYGAEKRKLFPTDIGFIVNDFLVQRFPDIVDYKFTAQVEEKFDKIASGNYDWQKMLQEFYIHFEPMVESVDKTSPKEKGERLLGQDPETGENIYVKYGPYGPMVQKGDANSDIKPKYASVPPGMSILDVTLEDALELFKLPKKLGEYQNKEMVVGIGKYGPYVRWNNKFYPLPKHLNPIHITLDDAIRIVEEKNLADKPIFELDGEPVFLLSGKYGPYLKVGDLNVKIPRKISPRQITPEQAKQLISEKKEKEAANLVKVWKEASISIKKGGWGRFYVYGPGNKRKILPKDIDVNKISLEEAKKILQIK